jgi:hypothetical protein
MQAIDAASKRECHEGAPELVDLGYSTLFLADHYLRGDSHNAIGLFT